jgi:uncharacterized membrane protein YukC
MAVCFILPAAAPEKPDTNFKSIHQIQSQEHAADTLRPDTVKENTTVKTEFPPAVVPKVKTLSYASLLIVVLILLLILLVILIVIRHRQMIKRE